MPNGLSLASIKPEKMIGKVFFINLNRYARPCCVISPRVTCTSSSTSVPQNWSIHLFSTTLPDGADWSITPTASVLGTLSNVPVELSISSIGLPPNDFDMSFVIHSQTDDSLQTNEYLNVSLSCATQADGNTTQVKIKKQPTIGEAYDGVQIWPRDVEGWVIDRFINDDFSVTLTRATEESHIAIVTCGTSWNKAGYYISDCTIPNLGATVGAVGNWTLQAKLGDAYFYSTTVRMQCPSGEYETAENACEPCPRGVACQTKGVTLQSLPIAEGWWRSSASSDDIRACPCKFAFVSTLTHHHIRMLLIAVVWHTQMALPLAAGTI